LIEANAEVNQAYKDSFTRILIVSQEGHLEVVKCLMRSRAESKIQANDQINED